MSGFVKTSGRSSERKTGGSELGRRLLTLLATLVVVIATACSSDNSGTEAIERRERALDRREGELDQRESDLDEREQELENATTTTVAPATTAALPTEFPREVPIDAISDPRARAALQAGGPVTSAVEVFPGVYANKGSAPIGPVTQYKSVYGLCSDVEAFRAQQGTQFSLSCW
jgi:hypothetical protein